MVLFGDQPPAARGPEAAAGARARKLAECRGAGTPHGMRMGGEEREKGARRCGGVRFDTS